LAGLKGYLALIVAVWAYYHVLRQHYGFMMLYKVKNSDLEAWDNRLDAVFLYTALILPPFSRFFIHGPEELGLPKSIALGGIPGFEIGLWLVFGGILALYLARQVQRLRNGHPLNVPKMLLLVGVIPLHWLTFEFMSWRAAVPTVTIVHNLQYHAIIWFHNRNRYGEGGSSHGRIPEAVSRAW
ncbi:MAG: hypothetical protein GY953_10180, partial [bacterium]|nr:hypothetical protein [bacterium]